MSIWMQFFRLQAPLAGVLSPAGGFCVLAFSFLILQLESTLKEKSQQLESLQEMKMTLEEQLKKETAAKVKRFCW